MPKGGFKSVEFSKCAAEAKNIQHDGSHPPVSIFGYSQNFGEAGFTFDNDLKRYAGAMDVPLHNTILAIGKAHFISVAPISKLPPKAKAGGAGKQRAGMGDIHAAVIETLNTPRVLRLHRALAAIAGDHAAISRAGLSGEAAKAAAVLRGIGDRMTALSRAGLSGLSLAERALLRDGRDRSGRLTPFHSPSSFAGGEAGVPHSIAPIRKTDVDRGRVSAIGGGLLGAEDAPEPAGAAGLRPINRFDNTELREAVAELLNREARLPPNGATGFDPLLSPAWAGLKLRH